MASEHRLHPSSIVFDLGAALLRFALPALVALLTAGSTGWLGLPWIFLVAIPPVIVSLTRYLTFRYRYELDEMVIRSGMIFRNERHVPYARIQNLDAVQNVFHRLVGVADVRVETGGGNEPEARMAVLPLTALAEMRQRVFADRERRDRAAVPAGMALVAGAPLLELTPSELLRCGLIEHRGLVMMVAAIGGLWQLGLIERTGNLVFGALTFGDEDLSDIVAAIPGAAAWPARHLLLVLAVLAAGLLLVALLSMAWAFVRLYGFRLIRVGADLRTEYGLLTRVATTIPLARIQTLTIHEGPWHRRLGRVSVSVETAGGNGAVTEGKNVNRRERLAPILRREDLAPFVDHVVPGLSLVDVEWRAHHPRAFARKLKPSLAGAAVSALPFVVMLGWRGLAALPLLLGWSLVVARKQVNHLGWAVTESAVLFRSGWIWRKTTAAPFAKIQVATLAESPFDRRSEMATVAVDAAGAGQHSHRIDIPYLGRETARDLHAMLSARAEGAEFRW